MEVGAPEVTVIAPALASAPAFQDCSTSPPQRKPLLLFLLAGLFLLRFDTRTFLGLLFQDPPRRTNPVLLPQKAACR